MTVYKDIDQINRIINMAPDNFDFYVHIDRKSPIRVGDISKRAKVFSEFKINWGAVEHLKAFLLLIEKAYASGEKYDFYHLITGQDFYACNFDEFDKLLQIGKNYVSYFSLPRKGWWHGGLDIVRYKSLASKYDLRQRKFKLLDVLYYWWQRLITKGHTLPSYRLYGGLVYCSISGGAIDWVLDSDISKDLLLRLENTTCGEEIFFQTVLLNSPLKNSIVNNNLRYTDWSVHCPPKFLNDEDYDKIIKSHNIFCRKIDSNLSSKLISKLLLFLK